MDHRRFYGLRPPRPLGDSTFLVPQMENYALFASPFIDLRKEVDKLIEGWHKNGTDQSENGFKAKGTSKDGDKPEEEIKMEVDFQISSDETSQSEVNFGIVLNVVTVKPEELVIEFRENNVMEVKVVQRDVILKDRITFSRNCSYKYELPDGIDKTSLVALRTRDDYLIILPRDLLREDLLQKSTVVAEGPEESSDKDVSSKKVTEDTDEESNGIEESELMESKAKRSKEESKPKKESKTKPGEKSSKPNDVPLDEDKLIPLQVSRVLRPGMDIFMLRKYISDLESFVTTVRKYIENYSFISENSRTAERCLRRLAKLKTDKYYEERNIKGPEPKSKFTKGPSPESGKLIAKLAAETLGETSGSSRNSGLNVLEPNK